MATKTPKKAAEKAKEPAVKVYVALQPVEHDGERYEPDDELALTDAQAEPLLGWCIAEPTPA